MNFMIVLFVLYSSQTDAQRLNTRIAAACRYLSAEGRGRYSKAICYIFIRNLRIYKLFIRTQYKKSYR